MTPISTTRIGSIELSGPLLRQPDGIWPSVLFQNFIPFKIIHKRQVTNADETVCFEGEVFEYWGFSNYFDEVDEAEQRFDDPNFVPEKYVFIFNREIDTGKVAIQECLKKDDYVARMNTQLLKNSMRNDSSSVNQCERFGESVPA